MNSGQTRISGRDNVIDLAAARSRHRVKTASAADGKSGGPGVNRKSPVTHTDYYIFPVWLTEAADMVGG